MKNITINKNQENKNKNKNNYSNNIIKKYLSTNVQPENEKTKVEDIVKDSEEAKSIVENEGDEEAVSTEDKDEVIPSGEETTENFFNLFNNE
jgi:hypothetical protein